MTVWYKIAGEMYTQLPGVSAVLKPCTHHQKTLEGVGISGSRKAGRAGSIGEVESEWGLREITVCLYYLLTNEYMILIFLKNQEMLENIKRTNKGQRCRSVVKHMLSIFEALGLVSAP